MPFLSMGSVGSSPLLFLQSEAMFWDRFVSCVLSVLFAFYVSHTKFYMRGLYHATSLILHATPAVGIAQKIQTLLGRRRKKRNSFWGAWLLCTGILF